MKFYFIFDSSGSFNELGKQFIQNNLKRYIKEYLLINSINISQVFFYDFSEKLISVEIDLERDIVVSPALGRCHINELAGLLNVNGENTKVLWLTDGYLETKKLKPLKEVKATLSVVLIGIDANSDFTTQLKKYIAVGNIHYAENIKTALDLFFSTVPEANVPLSCKNFRVFSDPTKIKEETEESDDWD